MSDGFDTPKGVEPHAKVVRYRVYHEWANGVHSEHRYVYGYQDSTLEKIAQDYVSMALPDFSLSHGTYVIPVKLRKMTLVEGTYVIPSDLNEPDTVKVKVEVALRAIVRPKARKKVVSKKAAAKRRTEEANNSVWPNTHGGEQ